MKISFTAFIPAIIVPHICGIFVEDKLMLYSPPLMVKVLRLLMPCSVALGLSGRIISRLAPAPALMVKYDSVSIPDSAMELSILFLPLRTIVRASVA